MVFRGDRDRLDSDRKKAHDFASESLNEREGATGCS
jgi:hypothetical protein